MSNREASLRELVELMLRQKERVRGAHAVLCSQLLHRLEQSVRHPGMGRYINITTKEELGPCSGCEGHGGYQLGVVGEPVLLVGPRPLPVENVLPVGVRLQIQTEGAEDTSTFSAHQIGRRPSAAAANAARVLERVQELEVEERELWRLQRAPHLPVHILDAPESLHSHQTASKPINLKPAEHPYLARTAIVPRSFFQEKHIILLHRDRQRPTSR